MGQDGTGRDERNMHGRSKQANPFFFFFSQSPHLQRQVRPEMVRGSELGAILSTSSMARETAILTMMVKKVEKVKKEKKKRKMIVLACPTLHATATGQMAMLSAVSGEVLFH